MPHGGVVSAVAVRQPWPVQSHAAKTAFSSDLSPEHLALTWASGTYEPDVPAVFPSSCGIGSCPGLSPCPSASALRSARLYSHSPPTLPTVSEEPKVRSKGSRPTRKRLVLTLAWLLIHHVTCSLFPWPLGLAFPLLWKLQG